LNVGADLYLTRPFRDEEVVAQVGALLEMANRLRKQQESFTSEGPASGPGAAFSGDIAQMSVATVLTLLELERRSGHLKVRSDSGKIALLELEHGGFAGATLDEQPVEASDVLRETLRWTKGSFTFRSAAVTTLSAPPRQTIGGLLLEAMRLEDEARR